MNRNEAREQLLKKIASHMTSTMQTNQIAKESFLNDLFFEFDGLDLDNKAEITQFRNRFIIPALKPTHPCNQFSGTFGFVGAYINHLFHPNHVTKTQTKTRQLIGLVSDFIEINGLLGHHTEIERRLF